MRCRQIFGYIAIALIMTSTPACTDEVQHPFFIKLAFDASFARKAYVDAIAFPGIHTVASVWIVEDCHPAMLSNGAHGCPNESRRPPFTLIQKYPCSAFSVDHGLPMKFAPTHVVSAIAADECEFTASLGDDLLYEPMDVTMALQPL